MGSDKNEDGVFRCALLGDFLPLCEFLQCFPSKIGEEELGNVVDQENCCCISEECLDDRSEALLTCSVPDLKFYRLLIFNRNGFALKLSACMLIKIPMVV